MRTSFSNSSRAAFALSEDTTKSPDSRLEIDSSRSPSTPPTLEPPAFAFSRSPRRDSTRAEIWTANDRSRDTFDWETRETARSISRRFPAAIASLISRFGSSMSTPTFRAVRSIGFTSFTSRGSSL